MASIRTSSDVLDKGDIYPYTAIDKRGIYANYQSFFGITIVMYLRNKEHNPPHIHAITAEYDSPFLISTGEIIEGEFPGKARALVKEFVLKYRTELETMWETEHYVKLPPLE